MKGKQDNTILWVAGAVAIGWFLAPKALKEQITGGVPGIGIDLSGLLGGGVGQAPLDFGSLISGFEFPSWEFPPFPETPLLDYTGIIQDILDAGNTAADVVGQAASDALSLFPGGEKGSDPAPTVTTPPTPPYRKTPLDVFNELEPFTQNVVAILAGVIGVGGTYGAVKAIQAIAPAGKTVATAMGNVVARAIEPKGLPGKPPAVTGIKKPPGVKTSLWKQWLKRTDLGLFKGGMKGFVRAGSLPVLAASILGIIFDPFVTARTGPYFEQLKYGEPADVTLPWPIPMAETMGNVVNITEADFSPSEPPVRRESPSMPMAETMGNVPVKKPLYQPPLEGVQW